MRFFSGVLLGLTLLVHPAPSQAGIREWCALAYSAIGGCGGGAAECHPQQLRLNRLREVYDAAVAKHPHDSAAAVVEFYQSRELLPEGGVVHIVGPGNDFYEWAIPLIVRPDVQVIISEGERTVFVPMTRRFLFQTLALPFKRITDTTSDAAWDSNYRLQWIYGEIERNNPAVIRRRAHTEPDQAYRVGHFWQDIAARLWVKSYLETDHFDVTKDQYALIPPSQATNGPILSPKADLLFSRMPHAGDLSGGEMSGFTDAVKENGTVWVISENLALRAPSLANQPRRVALPGAAARFEPSEEIFYGGSFASKGSRGNFAGMWAGDEVFLIAPEPKR